MAGIPAITIDNQPQVQAQQPNEGFSPVPQEVKDAFVRMKNAQASDADMKLIVDYYGDMSDEELARNGFGPISIKAVREAQQQSSQPQAPVSNQQTPVDPNTFIGAIGKEANVQRPSYTHKVNNTQTPQASQTSQTSDAMQGDARFQSSQPIEEQPTDKVIAEEQTIEQPSEPEAQKKKYNWQPVKDVFKAGLDPTDKQLKPWTPVAASVIAGAGLGSYDPSGEAAGYAAQAQQNFQNAAEFEKLRQRNMQKATDNRLAEKMAAAQAANKFKQNQASLGVEGGNAAYMNEAQDLDLKYQTEMQNERADVAAQNQEQVNKNKLMGIGNETNESMTNYATNVENSNNAYKATLANATSSENKNNNGSTSESKKDNNAENKAGKDNKEVDTNVSASTESAADTGTTEDTSDNITSIAESNQAADTVENTTEEISDMQKAQQLRDRAEAIRKEIELPDTSKAKRKELWDEYTQDIMPSFNALPENVKQGGIAEFKFPNVEPEDGWDYNSMIDAVYQKY